MKTSILKTGISLIDKHHEKLFSLINSLDDIIENDKCNKDLAQIFYKLTYYIEDYFTDEELLYKKYSYPKLFEIKEDHRKFIKELSPIRSSFFDGNEQVCITLKLFLLKWFQKIEEKNNSKAMNFLKEKIEFSEL